MQELEILRNTYRNPRTISTMAHLALLLGIERTMTIQSPETDGKVEYIAALNELVAGEMKAAVKITDSGGKTFTELNPFIRQIRAAL